MMIGGFDFKGLWESIEGPVKANESSGVDLIAAELLQNLGQAKKNILFKLVCDVYKTGDIPNDYKVNKTVTIPKKVGIRQMR